MTILGYSAPYLAISHYPFSSFGSRPKWRDFNPRTPNVIAHAVTFSSNVLLYTFFLVLRGTLEPPESLKGFQDVQGRLWDVLTMFSFSARAMKKLNIDVAESQKDTAQTLYFKTIFQMPSKAGNPKMETVYLKAICGPGDNTEPILTIMLLKED